MTTLPIEEWKRAFVNHIVTLLTEDGGWDVEDAKESAANELTGLEEPIDTSQDPAAAADEAMSYWEGEGGE